MGGRGAGRYGWVEGGTLWCLGGLCEVSVRLRSCMRMILNSGCRLGLRSVVQWQSGCNGDTSGGKCEAVIRLTSR
jgi:hypothetical protein